MAWICSLTDKAIVQLKKIDKVEQNRILKFVKQRLETDDDPKRFGGALSGNLEGSWKYRVGDYRLICKHFNETKHIFIMKVGHRRNIYLNK